MANAERYSIALNVQFDKTTLEITFDPRRMTDYDDVRGTIELAVMPLAAPHTQRIEYSDVDRRNIDCVRPFSYCPFTSITIACEINSPHVCLSQVGVVIENIEGVLIDHLA